LAKVELHATEIPIRLDTYTNRLAIQPPAPTDPVWGGSGR
jgi:hypothetical protein